MAPAEHAQFYLLWRLGQGCAMPDILQCAADRDYSHTPRERACCLDGRLTFVGVVADVAGRHHEDDVFGDVGGVVADALEMAGNQDEIERGLDGAGSCSM